MLRSTLFKRSSRLTSAAVVRGFGIALSPKRPCTERPSSTSRADTVRNYAETSSAKRTRRSKLQLELNTEADEAESSTARGTRYELLCRDVLHQLFGMELTRTGGAGDRGVDLRGWWEPKTVPDQKASKRIRVLAQCKCQDEGGKKMGPVLVREVEGVVFRAASPSQPASPTGTGNADSANDVDLASDDDAPVAGIILSSSGFSKQALLQVRSSNVPLAAMHVLAQPQSTSDVGGKHLVERCVSIVWNDRFGSSHGLLPGGMEARWIRSLSPRQGAAEGTLGRPVIYRSGKPLH